MEKSSVRGGGARAGTAPLPLPPPPRLAAAISSSSPASIRALLARTAGNGAADGQSPRSLLSRILQRGGGGEGGGNGAFGCRVRLPRRYGSSGGGGGRKDGAAEQADATPRVKVVERAPELPLETPRSSLGLGPLGMKRPEEEVMSMNVGLGASLVLLLSKSAVELNKMVELRAQMEAMVSEIRQQRKPHVSAAASSSSQESNGSTAIKDSIACATSEDALSNSSRTADHRAVRDSPLSGSGGGAVVVMHQMEAELQAELDRLQKQRAVHGDKRVPPMQGLELPVLQVKTMRSNVSDSPARSCVVDDAAQQGDDAVGEEVDDDDDDDCEEGQGDCRSPPHGGVSARALERRLHEVLQKRQQDRIVELESALDAAQRRLQEREREVVWWRDAAKLVSHRRDESRRLR